MKRETKAGLKTLAKFWGIIAFIFGFFALAARFPGVFNWLAMILISGVLLRGMVYLLVEIPFEVGKDHDLFLQHMEKKLRKRSRRKS